MAGLFQFEKYVGLGKLIARRFFWTVEGNSDSSFGLIKNSLICVTLLQKFVSMAPKKRRAKKAAPKRRRSRRKSAKKAAPKRRRRKSAKKGKKKTAKRRRSRRKKKAADDA